MSGNLREQLPPVRELMEKFGAANGTVQRAIAILRDEGFIDSRQGAQNKVRTEQMHIVRAGAYIAPEPNEYSFSLLEVKEVPAPLDVAEALEVEPGELVAMREQVMLRQGAPVELAQLYFPVDLARGTKLAIFRKIKGGVPAVFAELGLTLASPIRDVVTTRPPTTEELETLELPSNTPVLRTFRATRSQEGRPVEVQVLVKGGHLYGLEYSLSAH